MKPARACDAFLPFGVFCTLSLALPVEITTLSNLELYFCVPRLANRRLLSCPRLKLQVDRLHRWREWEADAETVVELCGDEEEGDEDAAAMLDEAMEVKYFLVFLWHRWG